LLASQIIHPADWHPKSFGDLPTLILQHFHSQQFARNSMAAWRSSKQQLKSDAQLFDKNTPKMPSFGR
jgi:hypothetical protein